jgi:hypothetical protein
VRGKQGLHSGATCSARCRLAGEQGATESAARPAPALSCRRRGSGGEHRPGSQSIQRLVLDGLVLPDHASASGFAVVQVAGLALQQLHSV